MNPNPPPQPPNPDDVTHSLSRVNQLGTATEQLFRRLYKGIGRRSSSRAMVENQRDLLQQRLREQSVEIEQIRGLIATLPDGVIMQDNEGRIVLINPAARALLGSVKSFWSSELGQLFTEFREITAMDGDSFQLSEPRTAQLNNLVIGAQLAAVADENGNRIGTMMLLRDVTTDTLSERLKDQFVTAISHELRTPMAVIKGVSEVLVADSESSGQSQKLLQTLSRNVDILDRMVVELLDVSEMSSEEFVVDRQPVNLEDLIGSVTKSLRAEIKRGKLNALVMMRDVSALHVLGDEQRLRWALGHLLQNSIRYTEPGGFITIVGQRSADGQIALTISDTGVGISDKDLPHIFERFYRGEPRTASGKLLDPRGLGQGLFIARKVIEAHDGYVTVQSQPGSGSSFTVVLPAA